MTVGDEDPVPVELTTSQIAEACGISRKRVVRRLRFLGLCDQAGSRRYVVSPTMLAARLPDWYQRVYNHYFFKREKALHQPASAPPRPRPFGA